jgi:hypothetical protein
MIGGDHIQQVAPFTNHKPEPVIHRAIAERDRQLDHIIQKGPGHAVPFLREDLTKKQKKQH